LIFHYYLHSETMMLKPYLFIAALAILPGCATIVSDSVYPVRVETTPPGAACEVRRSGELIATVVPTPGIATVTRSSRVLDIGCRPANAPAGTSVVNVNVPADPNFWMFGNLIFGGLIGIVIDISTGAIGRYPALVTVEMPVVAAPPPPIETPEPAATPARDRRGRPISAMPTVQTAG